MPIQKTTVINPNHRKRNILLIVSAVVVVLAGIFATLELTDTTYVLHKRPPAPTASQNTKGEVEDTSTTPTPGSSSTAKPGTAPAGSDSEKDPTDGTVPTTLIAPSGNFVSAHKVPVNAPIASVCNTSTGATCKITFTSGSVTKSLSAEVADKGGSVYWNSWTPASLGLTPGTWTIQAVATLNGQTQTSNDALPLEISQ